jgi:hypothetical protein
VSAQASIIGEVRGAIRELMNGGQRVHAEEVAGLLFLSRATMQRRLDEAHTTFTHERQAMQVTLALEMLTHGASCSRAAWHVGLSGDHLCRLISDASGLDSRQVARAAALAARAQRWRRSVPPRSGTRPYTERLRKWNALEAELTVLLEPVSGPENPLWAWAGRVRRNARRPDYRRGRAGKRVRATRRRERAAREAQLRALQRYLRSLEPRDGWPAAELASWESWLELPAAPVRRRRRPRGARA